MISIALVRSVVTSNLLGKMATEMANNVYLDTLKSQHSIGLLSGEVL